MLIANKPIGASPFATCDVKAVGLRLYGESHPGEDLLRRGGCEEGGLRAELMLRA